MKTKFVLTLVAVLFVGKACGATVLLNTVDDFSTTAQGTNGLEYGYYTTPEQSTGTFSTANMSVVSGQWVGVEAFGTPVFSADVQHPGASTAIPAVRRYTVGSGGETAFTGLVQIMGQFGGGPPVGGGSVIGFVTVDGVTMFSALADGGTTATFDFLAAVSPGSHLDFGLMANGDPSFDATYFSATVLVAPEPSKALLILVGLAFAASRRVRKLACESANHGLAS